MASEVIVQLFGGLGNQLFQYSAALCLAKKRNTGIIFDLSRFENSNKNETPRSFALAPFNLDVNLLSSKQKANIEAASISSIKNKILAKLSINTNYYHFFSESNAYSFHEDFMDLPRNSYLLNSYFQNLRYILPIKDLLKQNLNLTKHKLVSTGITVGVHVRRGDYISLESAADFHGTCNAVYYQQAIKLMLERHPNAEFVFFSDEVEWIKNNMNLPTKHSFPNNTNDFEDFVQLSQCTHQIIANSSFSWWAAWLNPNLNKIVITPKKWVNDPTIDTSGLLPYKWIQL